MFANKIPGYNNIISLSGTKIDADSDLKDLLPGDRNCLFGDEIDRYHKLS